MKTIPGPLTDAEIIGHLDNHQNLGPHGHDPEALEQIRAFEIWRVNERNKAWLRNFQREQAEKANAANQAAARLKQAAESVEIELKRVAVIPGRGGFAVVVVALPPGVFRGRVQARRAGEVNGGWAAFGGWFSLPASKTIGPLDPRSEWEVAVEFETDDGDAVSESMRVSLADFKEGKERRRAELAALARKKKEDAARVAAGIAEQATKLLRMRKAAEKLRLRRIEEEKRAAERREAEAQKQRLLKSAREKGLKDLEKASPELSVKVRPSQAYGSRAIVELSLRDPGFPPGSRYQLLSRPAGAKEWSAFGPAASGHDLPLVRVEWIYGPTEFCLSCGTKYGRVNSDVVFAQAIQESPQPPKPPEASGDPATPEKIILNGQALNNVRFGIENRGVIPRGTIRPGGRTVGDSLIFDYRELYGKKFCLEGRATGGEFVFHLTELNQIAAAGARNQTPEFTIINDSPRAICFWLGGIANLKAPERGPIRIAPGKGRRISISPQGSNRYDVEMSKEFEI